MATLTSPKATLADLAKVTDKAELIAGRIVPLMPTGRRPNRVAFRIARSLDDFVRKTCVGEAYTDNVGFAVPKLTSGRESFSPDASYFAGPFPANEMGFLKGPPTFAVEVRSDSDCGLAGEIKMAEKRAEYFEAGTRVVWDVDPVNDVIFSYTSESPDQATEFRPGQQAHAEHALIGWSIDVQEVFQP